MLSLYRILVWHGLALLAVALSVGFNTQSDLARDLGRKALTHYVSTHIQGTLRIGRVEHFSFTSFEASDASVLDGQGRLVIAAERATLHFDWLPLLRGELHFAAGSAERGFIRLYEEENLLPSMVTAFIPPPREGKLPGPPPIRARVERLDVREFTVVGDALGVKGLEVRNVSGFWRLEVNRDVSVHIERFMGDLVGPFPFVAHVENVGASISTDLEVGARVWAAAHIGREHFDLAMGFRQSGDGPGEFELDLDAQPLRLERLAQVGVVPKRTLTGEGHGHLRLRGPITALTAEVGFHDIQGGDVYARATLDGLLPQTVRVAATKLNLGRLDAALPSVTLTAKADAAFHVRAAQDAEPARLQAADITLSHARLSWEGLTVAGVRGRARFFPDKRLDISSLTVPLGKRAVRLRGSVGVDGAYALQVDTEDLDIGHVSRMRALGLPLADGRVSGRGTLRGGPDRPPAFEGAFVGTGLKLGDFSAEEMKVSGPLLPLAQVPPGTSLLEMSARGVVFMDRRIESARVQMSRRSSVYALLAQLYLGRGDSLEARARFSVSGRGYWRLHLDSLRADVAGHAWEGQSGELTYRPLKGVSVADLSLSSERQAINVSGEWWVDGDKALSIGVKRLDVAQIDRLLFADGLNLSGLLDARLDLSGQREALEFTATGQLRDGGIFEAERVNLVFRTVLAEGEATLDGQFDFGELGTLYLGSSALLFMDGATWQSRFENAVYDVQSELVSVDLSVLAGLLKPYASLPLSAGRASGRFDVSGPLLAPSFEGHLSFEDLILPDLPPVGARFDGAYAQGRFVARGALSDRHGPLVEGEVSILSDVVLLISEPDLFRRLLEVVPWGVALHIPTRAWEQLPSTLQARLPDMFSGLRLGGKASLNRFGRRPKGMARINLEFPEDLGADCLALVPPPRFQVRVSFDDPGLDVTVTGFAGRQAVLFAQSSMGLPIESWLSGAAFLPTPPERVSARLDRFPLAAVPFSCHVLRGTLSGQLIFNDLAKDSRSGDAVLSIEGLQIIGQRGIQLSDNRVPRALGNPAAGRLALFLRGERLDLSGQVLWPGGNAELGLGGSLVLESSETTGLAIKRDAVHFGRLTLVSVPIEGLEVLTPGVARIGGAVTGSLVARGTLDDFDPSGSLVLSEGYLQVEALGQQLSDVSGRLVLRNKTVEVQTLRAEDRDGSIDVHGTVSLREPETTTARLFVNFDKFPARNQGSLLATVQGQAALRAQLGDPYSRVAVDLGGLSLDVSGGANRSFQGLELHNDVTVVTSRRELATPAQESVIELELSAPDTLRIKSDTFEARVSLDLNVVSAENELTVDGLVLIDSGEFYVGAQRFAVERGSLSFARSTEIDPQVSLVAVHPLRSSPGASVTVTVTGRLSDPRVEFTSTESNNQAEIIQLLLSGSRGLQSQQMSGTTLSEQQAGQQAASFLAGITASFLTVVTRRQSRELLPILAIESGEDGFRSTRFRAGIQADRLVPDRFKSVVRGIYVEGFYTANAGQGDDPSGAYYRPSTAGPLGADAGVLLDIRYPYGLGTDIMFAPPASWGVDLTWEP